MGRLINEESASDLPERLLIVEKKVDQVAQELRKISSVPADHEILSNMIKECHGRTRIEKVPVPNSTIFLVPFVFFMSSIVSSLLPPFLSSPVLVLFGIVSFYFVFCKN